MKKFLLLITVISVTLIAKAQLNNEHLEFRTRPDSLKAGDLYLSLYNFNFLRNYEFFNDFQDGYTLYGTQLEPQLVYYAHPRLSLSAGVHLRKDFGGKGIYKTYPLFSIKYHNRNTTLINGVIEGNVQHRFIEPVFDFERKINHPAEYGTQVIINKPSLFLDAYVNWDNMIYEPSGEQEKIFAGGSADITLKEAGKMRLSVPLQVTAFHQGGQIDTIDAPLKTILNGAAGFKLAYAVGEGLIRSVTTENYIVAYKDQSSTKEQLFNGGSAIFLNGGIESRYGNLVVSYWNGNKYISPTGMPLYQSVSYKLGREGYGERTRELIIARYVYAKELVPGFFLDFRLEPVFDLKSPGSKSVEFYHSLFFVYKKEFRLLGRK